MKTKNNRKWSHGLKYVVITLAVLMSGCATSKPLEITQAASETPIPTQTQIPTQTNTPTPTYTLTPSASPTITSTPIHATSVINFHRADEEIPYHWYSYVSSGLSKTEPVYILVTGIRAELSDDYDGTVNIAKGEIQDRRFLAQREGYILLVPHIPRPATNHIYVPAFAREVFLKSTNELFQRPDLKITLMIDQLTAELRQDGYDVQDKVFLEGFSIGGMFAQRYAILHPERVQAISAGAPGGALTLPESSFDGTEINWPAGLGDFEILTGYSFNAEAYSQIPQFIYVGENDMNTTLAWAGELWQASQIDFIESNFGNTPAEIVENQCTYLQGIGYNITYKIYPNVEHRQIDEAWDDLLLFFEAHK